MKVHLVAVTVFIAVVGFVAWLPYKENGFDIAGLKRDAFSKDQVKFADYTPFDWTEVRVYNQYWNNREVARAVGSRRPFPDWNFPQGVSESSSMLIFIDGDRPVSVVGLQQYGITVSVPSHAADRLIGFTPSRNGAGWIHLQEVPSQELDPAPTAVTIPAGAGFTPTIAGAHLKH